MPRSPMDRRSHNLVIRTSADGKNVVVAVEDSGTGIDMEHVDRLFEPPNTVTEASSGNQVAAVKPV